MACGALTRLMESRDPQLAAISAKAIKKRVITCVLVVVGWSDWAMG